MEKKNCSIGNHSVWPPAAACCTKTCFGKGALLALVVCILVLGTGSASFSAPAVGSPYYLECKVYVMSNSQVFTTVTTYNYAVFVPVFNEETNIISYEVLNLFNTEREALYFNNSSVPMGRVYFWHGTASQKRWDVWQILNKNFALRQSAFRSFEASASSWAGAVLPFGSDPNEIFPNGCSDLPSQQPDGTPNFDTGRPECNEHRL